MLLPEWSQRAESVPGAGRLEALSPEGMTDSFRRLYRFPEKFAEYFSRAASRAGAMTHIDGPAIKRFEDALCRFQNQNKTLARRGMK